MKKRTKSTAASVRRLRVRLREHGRVQVSPTRGWKLYKADAEEGAVFAFSLSREQFPHKTRWYAICHVSTSVYYVEVFYGSRFKAEYRSDVYAPNSATLSQLAVDAIHTAKELIQEKENLL